MDLTQCWRTTSLATFCRVAHQVELQSQINSTATSFKIYSLAVLVHPQTFRPTEVRTHASMNICESLTFSRLHYNRRILGMSRMDDSLFPDIQSSLLGMCLWFLLVKSRPAKIPLLLRSASMGSIWFAFRLLHLVLTLFSLSPVWP